MARMIRALAVTVIVATLTTSVSWAQSGRVQLALTGTLLFGQDSDGELSGIAGPALRLDIDLGRRFMVSPEALATLGWKSVSPAATMNFKFGSCYAGLGPMILHGRWLLKAHLGAKVDHWLIEAVYVRGAKDHPYGDRAAYIGMTLGLIF